MRKTLVTIATTTLIALVPATSANASGFGGLPGTRIPPAPCKSIATAVKHRHHHHWVTKVTYTSCPFPGIPGTRIPHP